MKGNVSKCMKNRSFRTVTIMFSIDLPYCEWLFSWITKFENKTAVDG